MSRRVAAAAVLLAQGVVCCVRAAVASDWVSVEWVVVAVVWA